MNFLKLYTMKYTFENYEELYDSYISIAGWEEVPRSLRLFDIRFRLALDLQIDFEGGRARVRTDVIKESYQRLYKLVDMFNAYEAFGQFYTTVFGVKCQKGRVKNESPNSDFEEYLEKTGADKVLKHLAKAIFSRMESKKNFKDNFDTYLDKIVASDRLQDGMLNAFNEMKLDFKQNNSTRVINLLSLIYAERNQFYHNGEAAKMGMTYANRKWILEQYRETLIQVLLNNICYQLREEMRVMMN